jgi:hypothetical protein
MKMIENGHLRELVAAVVAGCLAAGAGVSGCAEDSIDTDTVQSEITNGTDVTDNSMRVGALYSKWKNPATNQIEWFPRPCSSTRITVDGWYLTARHCITLNGVASGTLLTPSQIKVSERVNPGKAPPSDAITATSIVDSPEAPRLDVALVFVPGTGYQGPIGIGQLTSFHVGSPSILVGASVDSVGYGRKLNNQPDDNAEVSPSSGAGRLRDAWLPVQGWAEATSTSFRGYTLGTNGLSQMINHGDSGGPDFVNATLGGVLLGRLQTGVHINANGIDIAHSLALSEPKTFQWIGQTVGKMYIKRGVDANNANATYLDVQYDNPAARTLVWTYPGTDTRAQHWLYNPVDKSIRNENGRCLDVKFNGTANGTPVWMWDCTGGTAQQWTFTDYLSIRNANGKCLDVPNGASQVPLQIWDCLNNTNQQWFITAAP